MYYFTNHIREDTQFYIQDLKMNIIKRSEVPRLCKRGTYIL